MFEVAVNANAMLGEGPSWDAVDGSLLWVDIEAGALHRFSAESGDGVVELFDEPLGAAVPTSDGGLLAAVGRGLVRISSNGERQVLASDLYGDRLNDGKCDPFGRFLVGGLTYDRRPGACSLYSMEGGRLTTILSSVTLSNGMGWSPDGKVMYYIDTPTRKVISFDYDGQTGAVSGERILIDFGDAPGNPDGMTVDDEGGLWVAMVRSGSIRRYSPDGQLDDILTLPASFVTSCAFGGPDLDLLYVTSGRGDLPESVLRDEPLAGALFVCEPGVRGKAPSRYGLS